MRTGLGVVTALSATPEYPQERLVMRTGTWPTDGRVRWTAWNLVDRFTLHRMDGSQVDASWQVVYEGARNEVVDTYWE
jgi:hypothetical protein